MTPLLVPPDVRRGRHIDTPKRVLYRPSTVQCATIARRRTYSAAHAPVVFYASPVTATGTGTAYDPTVGRYIDLGTWDIRPYMRLAGDIIWRIPNGAYYGGDLSDADHPATGGVFNGAAILRPVTDFGATIYQSPPGTVLPGGLAVSGGDLRLKGTTKRILMVGFNYRDGTLRPSGNTTATGPLYREWYCTHQFLATTWAGEAGHGDHTGGTYNQYHDTPRTIDTRGASGSGDFPTNLGLYGCDFSNTGTAIFYGAGSHTLKMVGVKASLLDDGGSLLDPLDLNHPDIIGAVAGAVDIVVQDSYFHPGRGSNDTTAIIVQEHFGSATLNTNRLWVVGAALGINLQGDAGHTITGTFQNTYVWNNYPLYDPDENVWDYIKNAVGGSSITMSEAGLHLHTANRPTATPDDGSDYASAWRAAWPINSFVTYFTTVEGWV